MSGAIKLADEVHPYHGYTQPVFLLGCGLLSLVGLGLPLASQGSYSVSILMLAEYYRLSLSNALPLVLGILAPLTMFLAIRNVRSAIRNLAGWSVVIGLCGLAISSLGYFEGVHHIKVFGSSCMPQFSDNDPLAEPGIGIGWGAILHLVAYAALAASGIPGMVRSASGDAT